MPATGPASGSAGPVSSPAVPSPARFVILAAPRTGSNWLCSLLDSHPRVLCHYEVFNPEAIHPAHSLQGRLDLGSVADRDRDPLPVLARVWRESFGFGAVGFKLNRGQNALVFEEVLGDGGVRKLVLGRRNRLRTLVSERLAERTGEWESHPGLTIGTRVPLALTPDELRAHAARNGAYYAGLREALRASGQEWLEVSYEDLGEPEEHGRILRFLGLPEGALLSTVTRRQYPFPLSELVTGFAELARALRGTEFERDLHADG